MWLWLLFKGQRTVHMEGKMDAFTSTYRNWTGFIGTIFGRGRSTVYSKVCGLLGHFLWKKNALSILPAFPSMSVLSGWLQKSQRLISQTSGNQTKIICMTTHHYSSKMYFVIYEQHAATDNVLSELQNCILFILNLTSSQCDKSEDRYISFPCFPIFN